MVSFPGRYEPTHTVSRSSAASGKTLAARGCRPPRRAGTRPSRPEGEPDRTKQDEINHQHEADTEPVVLRVEVAFEPECCRRPVSSFPRQRESSAGLPGRLDSGIPAGMTVDSDHSYFGTTKNIWKIIGKAMVATGNACKVARRWCINPLIR